MGKIYLTMDDMVEEFKCSESTINSWVIDGKLPPPTIEGKPRRWHCRVLEEYALSQLRTHVEAISKSVSKPIKR